MSEQAQRFALLEAQARLIPVRTYLSRLSGTESHYLKKEAYFIYPHQNLIPSLLAALSILIREEHEAGSCPYPKQKVHLGKFNLAKR